MSELRSRMADASTLRLPNEAIGAAASAPHAGIPWLPRRGSSVLGTSRTHPVATAKAWESRTFTVRRNRSFPKRRRYFCRRSRAMTPSPTQSHMPQCTRTWRTRRKCLSSKRGSLLQMESGLRNGCMEFVRTSSSKRTGGSCWSRSRSLTKWTRQSVAKSAAGSCRASRSTFQRRPETSGCNPLVLLCWALAGARSQRPASGFHAPRAKRGQSR